MILMLIDLSDYVYLYEYIIKLNMFSNKKNNLPPRPHIPDSEYILEDLNNAPIDDIAFKIINKGIIYFVTLL